MGTGGPRFCGFSRNLRSCAAARQSSLLLHIEQNPRILHRTRVSEVSALRESGTIRWMTKTTAERLKETYAPTVFSRAELLRSGATGDDITRAVKGGS